MVDAETDRLFPIVRTVETPQGLQTFEATLSQAILRQVKYHKDYFISQSQEKEIYGHSKRWLDKPHFKQENEVMGLISDNVNMPIMARAFGRKALIADLEGPFFLSGLLFYLDDSIEIAQSHS